MLSQESILDVLDEAAEAFVFPMLDNGYLYPVAARLRAFRSDEHWALAFENFGFSVRAGVPHLCITVVGSGLPETKVGRDFASPEAYEAWKTNNRDWRQEFLEPIENDGWMDFDILAENDEQINLRGSHMPVPSNQELTNVHELGAVLEPGHVANALRALAVTKREELLARPEELSPLLRPDFHQVLRLEDWHHPDLAGGELPSGSATFRSLAAVLVKNDPALYVAEDPNTHWSNWPGGGTL